MVMMVMVTVQHLVSRRRRRRLGTLAVRHAWRYHRGAKRARARLYHGDDTKDCRAPDTRNAVLPVGFRVFRDTTRDRTFYVHTHSHAHTRTHINTHDPLESARRLPAVDPACTGARARSPRPTGRLERGWTAVGSGRGRRLDAGRGHPDRKGCRRRRRYERPRKTVVPGGGGYIPLLLLLLLRCKRSADRFR